MLLFVTLAGIVYLFFCYIFLIARNPKVIFLSTVEGKALFTLNVNSMSLRLKEVSYLSISLNTGTAKVSVNKWEN